jgi:hypothetical protein
MVLLGSSCVGGLCVCVCVWVWVWVWVWVGVLVCASACPPRLSASPAGVDMLGMLDLEEELPPRYLLVYP